MNLKQTKALLSSGQTETALQQLLTLTANADEETQKSAILLRAAWEYQEQEAINGVMSDEEAGKQRNRIAKGALDLITDIESDGAIGYVTQAGIQQDLQNSQTTALMQLYDNDQINVQDTTIRADTDANVIIGQGNTVNKKTVTGFGIRQFVTLFLVLLVLGGGGYWAYKELFKGQDKTYASLSDIQKELATLSDLNGGLRATLEGNRKEIESQLTKGLAALNDKDYKTAIQYLENVAKTTPASTIYQNIAYAYEQIGKQDKAKEATAKAKAINPNFETTKSIGELKGKYINVLSSENGCKILVTSSPATSTWNNGDDNFEFRSSQTSDWAVFGFKNDKKVKIKELAVFIPSTKFENPKEIIISYSNDSPKGKFTLIDTLRPFNALTPEVPFQKLPFTATTAKYIKIEIYSHSLNHTLYVNEIQLWGTLE